MILEYISRICWWYLSPILILLRLSIPVCTTLNPRSYAISINAVPMLLSWSTIIRLWRPLQIVTQRSINFFHISFELFSSKNTHCRESSCLIDYMKYHLTIKSYNIYNHYCVKSDRWCFKRNTKTMWIILNALIRITSFFMSQRTAFASWFSSSGRAFWSALNNLSTKV